MAGGFFQLPALSVFSRSCRFVVLWFASGDQRSAGSTSSSIKLSRQSISYPRNRILVPVPTKSSPSDLTVTWQCSPFSELTAGELYAAMEARQRVFVVEQQCPYLDADGSDHLALHLLGWRSTADGLVLSAYARLFPPGVKFAEASIGRVLTDPAARGIGLGRALMSEAIQRMTDAEWGSSIRLAAQMYLEAFYEEFDFRRVSEPYLEDDIWHVNMLRG